jgi:hypothetical protein
MPGEPELPSSYFQRPRPMSPKTPAPGSNLNNPKSMLPKFGELPEPGGEWRLTPGATPTTGVTTYGPKNEPRIFVSGHGNTIVPQSAYSGQGGPKIPGITSQNFHHPETQMAFLMRQNPTIKEATMWINHPTGPCPGCMGNIEKTLPKGSRLTVKWTENGVEKSHTFTGLGE